MVRTYWFVPGFNEASDNLDLQPFARVDHVEACRPRALRLELYVVGDGGPMSEQATTRSCSGRARRARSAPAAWPTAA